MKQGGPSLLLGIVPLWLGRLLAAVVGALILRQQVFLADKADYFLVLLSLWLLGAPFANFLDVLRRYSGKKDDDEPE